MAKKAKGDRIQVILECTEQKGSGVPGMSRYITTKNRKNTTERLEKNTTPTSRSILFTKKLNNIFESWQKRLLQPFKLVKVVISAR